MEKIYLIAVEYQQLLTTIGVIIGFLLVTKMLYTRLKTVMQDRLELKHQHWIGLVFKITAALVLVFLVLTIWGIKLNGLVDVLNLIASQYKLLITIAAVSCFPLLMKVQNSVLENMVRGRIDPHRSYRAGLLLKIISAFVILCLLLMIWGIELRGLLVVGSSLFAMLGVALFAGWSLLSNLTSFLLLFIQNDCRVGHWVRVVDGANFVEGRITEMGLMNVVMENVDGHKVIYPNNLFIVRPVMVLNTPPEKMKSIRTKRVIGKSAA